MEGFSARVGSGVFSTVAPEGPRPVAHLVGFSARVGSGVFSTWPLPAGLPQIIPVSVPVWALGSFLPAPIVFKEV